MNINNTVRYFSGFLFLGLIFASFAISKILLFITSVIFIFFAIREYRQMFSAKDIEIHRVIPEFIAAASAYIFIFDLHQYATPILIFGVFLSFLSTILKNKKPYFITTLGTICAFLLSFCALYIIKLFYMFPWSNLYFVVIFVCSILAGDFAASKIGPLFPQIHITPEISPNKTLAGSIFSFIFTFLVLCLLIPLYNYAFWEVLVLSLGISTAAQIGDLSISLIKRELELKHSGDFFKDYGGILDRVDAFIFSAPVAYYIIILLDKIA